MAYEAMYFGIALLEGGNPVAQDALLAGAACGVEQRHGTGWDGGWYSVVPGGGQAKRLPFFGPIPFPSFGAPHCPW